MKLEDFIGRLGKVQLSGTVESIKKDFNKNGKPYWKVYMDSGDVLFAWSWSRIAEVVVGEPAEFTIEKVDDFLHIQSSIGPGGATIDVNADKRDPYTAPFDDPTPPKRSYRKPSAGGGGKTDNEKASIKKQLALKCACQYAIAMAQGTGEVPLPEDVTGTADFFLKYINEE
jgi:hypothetical protein